LLFEVATFTAIIANETSCMDHTSSMTIHCYVMKDWKHFPFLSSYKNLIVVKLHQTALRQYLKLPLNDMQDQTLQILFFKMVCLGFDGIAAFRKIERGLPSKLKRSGTLLHLASIVWPISLS
jgi:hypothetical protein